MLEVNNKEIELLDKVDEYKNDSNKWKAFTLILALWSYVLVTVCYLMYQDVHKQDVIIGNQMETIAILMESKIEESIR